MSFMVYVSTDYGNDAIGQSVDSEEEALELMRAVVAGEHLSANVMAQVFDIGNGRSLDVFWGRSRYDTAKPPHPMIPTLNAAAARGARIWVG